LSYDAFISYSHSSDGRLAPALHRALQSLAKPWHQRRALHVFLDNSGLAVTHALWGAIKGALDESRYFIVLASPDAAASRWVNQEIDWWIRTKSADHILPVVTEGEWIWDARSGDFDWERSTAVPPALKDVFAQEPRHLDLRWAVGSERLDLDNSRFREAVAELAAPIHGKSKDDLESEDLRQHRRFRRVRFRAIAALVGLSLLAVVAGTVASVSARKAATSLAEANRQQRSAIEERQHAEQAAAEARKQEGVAKTQKELALASSAEAQRQQRLADKAAKEAQEAQRTAEAQQRVAEAQKRRAATAAAEAQRQQQIAQQQQQLAEASARQADLAAAQAREQQRIAKENQRRAEQAAKQAKLMAQRAQEQARLAQSRRLAGEAIADLNDRLDRALLLSKQGFEISPSAEARGALFLALEQTSEITTYLHRSGSRAQVLAASPDGRTVAVAHGNASEVELWDVAARRRLGAPLPTAPADPESAAFSHDGSSLAIGLQDGTVIVWDLPHRQVRRTLHLSLDYSSVAALAFGPDDTTLALADISVFIETWDLRTGRQLGEPFRCLDPDLGLQELAFSPDGRMLAADDVHDELGNGQVDLCDVYGRKSWYLAPTPGDGPAHGLAFSPDSSKLAVGTDHVVVVWDVPTRERYLTLQPGLNAGFTDVTFNARGDEVAAIADDRSATVWFVQKPDIAVNPGDVEILSTPIDNFVLGQGGGITSLAFAGGQMVGGDAAGRLILWDIDRTSRLSRRLSAQARRVWAADPTGRILAVNGDDGMIMLWDADRQRELGTVPEDGDVAGLTFSRDGGRLAIAFQDGSTAVWRVQGPQRLFRLAIGSQSPSTMAFSPDDRTLAVRDGGGAVVLVDTADGRLLARLRSAVAPDPDHTSLAFSPDGGMLAAAYGRGTIMVWDPRLRQPLALLRDPAAKSTLSLAFEPKRRTLAAVVSDGTTRRIRRWSVERQRVLDELVGGTADEPDLAFSSLAYVPDGSMLVAGTDSGTIQLWDAATLQRIGQAKAYQHGVTVSDLSFDRGGSVMLAADAEGGILRWRMGMTAWKQEACQIANRNLSVAEWNALIGSDYKYSQTCPGLPRAP